MWEVIATAIIKLITFGLMEPRRKDAALFLEFTKSLDPDSDSIEFLRDHDLGDPFSPSVLFPLNNIRDNWRNSHREFQVSAVKKGMIKFLGSLDSFLSLLSERSAMDRGNWISIGLRDYEDRPEMLEYRKNLNVASTKAYKNYEKLIDVARRKLPV